MEYCWTSALFNVESEDQRAFFLLYLPCEASVYIKQPANPFNFYYIHLTSKSDIIKLFVTITLETVPNTAVLIEETTGQYNVIIQISSSI